MLIIPHFQAWVCAGYSSKPTLQLSAPCSVPQTLSLGRPCSPASVGSNPMGDSGKRFKRRKKKKKKVGDFNLLGFLLALLQGNCDPLSPTEATAPVTCPCPIAQRFPDLGAANLLGSAGMRWWRMLLHEFLGASPSLVAPLNFPTPL